MFKDFCIENNFPVISSEHELLDVFAILIDKGLDPNNAYDFIVQKYGEEVISRYLINENLNMEIDNVIK